MNNKTEDTCQWCVDLALDAATSYPVGAKGFSFKCDDLNVPVGRLSATATKPAPNCRGKRTRLDVAGITNDKTIEN